MAFAKYFLIFSIIFQITNIALCANDDYGVFQLPGHIRVSNANYDNNVRSLLSTFLNESSRGSFNTFTGVGSDRAYGTYYCRGDLSAEECHTCLEHVRDYFVAQNGQELFSNSLIVPRSELQCVVHYANSSISLLYNETSSVMTWGPNTGDNLDNKHPQYSTTLMNALQQVASEAAGARNGTRSNFATKVVNVTGTEDKIHVLAQCTPYISASNCSNCLSDLNSFNPVDGPTTNGQRVRDYCLIRYNGEPLSSSSAYRKIMPSFFHVILVFLWTTYLRFM